MTIAKCSDRIYNQHLLVRADHKMLVLDDVTDKASIVMSRHGINEVANGEGGFWSAWSLIVSIDVLAKNWCWTWAWEARLSSVSGGMGSTTTSGWVPSLRHRGLLNSEDCRNASLDVTWSRGHWIKHSCQSQDGRQYRTRTVWQMDL